MLSPGTILGGRYQIVRDIGRGGMGEVYEAIQLALSRRVALKTIRADLAIRPDLLARFKREAESAAALGHPNLVQVTDFQAPPGEPAFLVMEMLDGSTLKDVIQAEVRLEPGRAAFIAVQLLAGLGAAHRAGIVHRDIKPGNVFLQSTSAMRDIVKVLDFGVAKLALDAVAGAVPMTQAGQILGTLTYMAPEQGVSGAPVDARTDLFAVGATLFHALSGIRPLDAREPSGARTPLDRVAPWLPRELAAIVERALERSPDARWSSADEMAAALQRFAGPPSLGALPSGPSALAGGPPRFSGSAREPSAIVRLDAPTAAGSTFGATSPGGPTTWAPPVAPMPYPVAPMPYPVAPARRPWWLLIPAVIGLLAAVPVALRLLYVREQLDPENFASTVDRETLRSVTRGCPAPDRCSLSREEHGLTYPLCTHKVPALTPYVAGDIVVAGAATHIGVITSVEAPGQGYRVRFYGSAAEQTLGEGEIAGRLCTRGSAESRGQSER